MILALDLGGSQIRTAALEHGGPIRARRRAPTPVEAGPQAVVSACTDLLSATYEELKAGESGRVATAVGVSAPGPLDSRSGVLIDPPNLGRTFRDIALGAAIEESIGLPAVIERDTNVAAMAEGEHGAAVGRRDYLYITVSTGIGGAIVSDGRLLMGADGTAGELGHLPVDMDGPRCGCGGRGHLEAIASGTAIARAGREAGERGESPLLATLLADAGAMFEARHVVEAEGAGDAVATAIMERARGAFAAVCVGLVDVFNPELIVVGGSLAQAQVDRWLEPARQAIAHSGFRTPARRAKLVPAALGDDVGLVGAACLVEGRRESGRWPLSGATAGH